MRLLCACALACAVSGFEVLRDDADAAELAEAEKVCERVAAGKIQNPVSIENCLQGNGPEEWDIPGAGDPSIQGFATQQSYVPGDVVEMKVKTDSPKYRVDVYRVGYYRGNGARKVASIKPTAKLPQEQPPCVSDEATLLVDCGTWRVSARWTVPKDAVSGVYFARLIREEPPQHPLWRTDASQVAPNPKFCNPQWDFTVPPPCGWDFAECSELEHAYGATRIADKGKLMTNALKEPRASHIYFVVRDDVRNSDILMQTADTTWHAYNTYGAPNTYGGVALKYHNFSRAGRFDGRVRSYKRSYNVPMLTRDQRSVNMLWQAEYPLIRWLERNGYDVSYWSGVDTHVMGEQLSRFKLYISIGHDEYWSTQQRKNVEAARDKGTSLAFMSGNEVYWNIRWEASIDGSGAPHRTMVVYKETQEPAKIDPKEDEWTGTFRDGKPFNPQGSWPENSLTGTIFTVNAWRNDALEVPAAYSKLRFWRNTPVAKLQKGERAVLLKGLLGHEWDEDVDNGHRPPGLVRLSETTINNVQYMVDAGATYDAGTGTHHLVLYKAPSGAVVFGAGTIQWSWGLDAHHDGQTGQQNQMENEYLTRVGVEQFGPEPSVQQATANLFSDMGVTPAAPQTSLVIDSARSSDADGPSCRVTSQESPKDAQVPTVTVRGTCRDAAGVVGSVEVSLDGGGRWHPAEIVGGCDAAVEWRFERTWNLRREAAPSVVRIQARGGDDSGNVGGETEVVRLHVSSDRCAEGAEART